MTTDTAPARYTLSPRRKTAAMLAAAEGELNSILRRMRLQARRDPTARELGRITYLRGHIRSLRAEQHPDERDSPPTAVACVADRHGTWRAYINHGCRCPEISARVRRAKNWQRQNADVRAAIPAARGPRDRSDVDLIAVARACLGDRLVLNTGERNEAIDRLDRRGMSAAEIARQLGCAQRTVTRRRKERREARLAAA